MTRLTRGTAGVAIALLAGITMGPETGAQARDGVIPAQQVQVSDLDRAGGPAGVAWLEGRRLHTPMGDTLALPWTTQAAHERSLRILGHRPHTWLVKDFSGDQWNVWAVTAGKRTKLFSVGISEGDVASIVPSRDSRRIAVSIFDGSDSSLLEIYNGRGHLVVSRTFDGDGAILDFSGPEAVIGTSGTQLWDVDGDTLTDLGADASGASLDNNLLLVRDSGGQVGPTYLNNPGTPAWTAPMAQPRINASGGRIVSRSAANAQDLTIRSVSSGTVLRTFQVQFLAHEAPLWGDNHTVTFLGATGGSGDRERLARCTVKGHCAADSAVRPRDRISIPPL